MPQGLLVVAKQRAVAGAVRGGTRAPTRRCRATTPPTVPSPGSSTTCATCPRRVRLREDEGLRERRPGMGTEAAGVGWGAGNPLGGDWRLRWLSRGPTAERKAHPAHRPGEEIRRAVSAFHSLLALQVGRLRPGGRWSAKSFALATPWTVAHQVPLSMGFFRQEYWSGLPFPSPG